MNSPRAQISAVGDNRPAMVVAMSSSRAWDMHWRRRRTNPFWCRQRCCNGGRVRRQRRRGRGHRRRGRGRGGARVIHVGGGRRGNCVRGGVELEGGDAGYVSEVGYVGLPAFARKCYVGWFVDFWEPVAVVDPAGFWRGPRRLHPYRRRGVFG
jgi:hypothetical protein